MPIYEYICNGCDRAFETLTLGERKAACPGCGTSDLRRQLSVFAVGAGGSGAGASRSPASARFGTGSAGGGGCGSCGDPRGPGACSMD